MSIFFIERRYKKLVERASTLKYEFNAMPISETELCANIQQFIDKTKKPVSKFLSFIPFVAEFRTRWRAAKCLKELSSFVDKAESQTISDLHNEISGLRKQVSYQIRGMDFLEDNLAKAKLENQQIKIKNAELEKKNKIKIVPARFCKTKDVETFKKTYLTFFAKKSNSFTEGHITYNIDSLNRRFNA
jgi:hypothetical protein